MQKPLRLRRAGRVILLDPGGKILLFRYDDPPPNGRHWATPGGGLDDGESFHDGAVRELAEETGWTDVAVGTDVVDDRTFTMDYMGELVRQREQLFLARVDAPERALGQVAAMHATDGIAASRWWGLAELEATSDDIWPHGLADLVRIYIVLRYRCDQTKEAEMRLSRHERRILRKITKDIRATDPRLASILENTDQRDKDAGNNGGSPWTPGSYVPFTLF